MVIAELFNDDLIALKHSNYTHISANSSIDITNNSLKKGYLHIRAAWEKYCNCVSYDTFREFAHGIGLPMAKLTYLSEYSGEPLNSYQVHPSDVKLLKKYILENAKQVTKTLYTHPDVARRFKLKA